MSYGLYDADLPYYPIPFYNLELMKLSSYYKRKREIVGLSPNFSPQRYNHFIVRQDFYNPYSHFKGQNVELGGRAFDGETYKPLPIEIERMRPDIGLYDRVKPNQVKGYNKSALSTMRRAEHLRLSLDGKTIWKDFERQFRNEDGAYGVIFHDYNLNDVEGARALIEESINEWIPHATGRRIGMKYPVIVDNKEDLISWLSFQPMIPYFSLVHKGLIDESYIPDLVEVYRTSNAIRQTSIDIRDCFTNYELVHGGIQRIFRNIINLRSHCLTFPLIYNENVLLDPDWKMVMKLILRYNTHLATNGDPEFFRRVEPFETLYSYCFGAIKQYQIKEPLLEKESIQKIFQFVRENNYDLFKDFYEYRGGEVRNDR
ncbi:MAG: hypothetical protein IKF29_17195 [Oceanobacillus sp.]|nr:hypothetical protein [Oceanobacillus sp.]